MKKLLLALTVLMLFMLVGCTARTTKTCQEGYELRPAVGYQYCDEIATTETTTAEITVTTDYHDDLEQILYDVLVIEYATNSCTREELNDYLEAYENEVEIYSYRIETLLDMIDGQLEGE